MVSWVKIAAFKFGSGNELNGFGVQESVIWLVGFPSGQLACAHHIVMACQIFQGIPEVLLSVV